MKLKIKKKSLRYGENPNQKSFILKDTLKSIFDFQISGKQISYNNIIDVDSGLKCLNEFIEPTCVIVKHNNPSGIASDENIESAYIKALESDPISAFGGVVLFNRKVNGDLAKLLINNFYEVIVSSKFNKTSLETLGTKKKLIIIDSSNLKEQNNEIPRSVNSGVLYQEFNSFKVSKSDIKLVSEKKSSGKILDDLIFAYKVAKHVKSNAIVLVNNKQTVGIGAGQMSRVDATKIAIMKYKQFFKYKFFVCASDAFFPFTDNIQKLLKLKCIGIIQPGGSINDDKIISYANKKKASLYFVKNRVFKH